MSIIVRVACFATVNISANNAAIVPAIYIIPLATIGACLLLIRSDLRVGIPENVAGWAERATDRLFGYFEKSRFGRGKGSA